MKKEYYIKMKNGQKVPVSEEIYREYKRPVWREAKRKIMRKLKKRSTSCHWKWQAPKHRVLIVPARYSTFVQSCMLQLLRRTRQNCTRRSKMRDTVH